MVDLRRPERSLSPVGSDLQLLGVSVCVQDSGMGSQKGLIAGTAPTNWQSGVTLVAVWGSCHAVIA